MNKLFVFLFVGWVLAGCSEPNEITTVEIVPEVAISDYDSAAVHLPIYDHFLKHFTERGFELWSFARYWKADKNTLPEKLLVIRHDVHYRDIPSAYNAFHIEKHYTGTDAATYFVLLNFPPEKTNPDYNILKQKYLQLIGYLSQENADVQPHISPWDEYIEQYSPWWSTLSLEQLQALVQPNYGIVAEENTYTIRYYYTDIMNFHDVEEKIPDILRRYNQTWTSETGLDVMSYAAHGSATAINYAFNNVYLLNLAQCRREDIALFETSSPEIRTQLVFLSDNDRPLWIENPETIQDGQYQLLMHPQVWENPQEYRDQY